MSSLAPLVARSAPLSIFTLFLRATLLLVFQHFAQIRQPQRFVVSDAPDPAALACTVNRDALDGKVSMIGDDANETRGEQLDDAQEPVRRSRKDRVLRRGVGGRECAERVDGVWVSCR